MWSHDEDHGSANPRFQMVCIALKKPLKHLLQSTSIEAFAYVVPDANCSDGQINAQSSAPSTSPAGDGVRLRLPVYLTLKKYGDRLEVKELDITFLIAFNIRYFSVI